MVKAVIVDAPGEQPRVDEVTLPEPGPGDVRVRVVAAGVCHSDLSMINGTLTPEFPLVLGHEASGVVVEAGAAAGIETGTRVVLNWAPACRSCWYCLHSEPWLCSAVEGVTSTAGSTLVDGRTAHHCMGVGAFAEEVVLPAAAVVPLPESVPLDIAALLGCSVLTGVGAVRNTARVRSGESVVVVGLGGIGLSAVLGARLAGAGPIIAVDVAPGKEERALRAGATHFLAGEPKLAKRIRGLTEGRGADHGVDCVGAPATIRSTWGSVRRGGQCTVVGIGGKDSEVSFSPLELFHFARTLTSSVYGASDPARDIPLLAEQMNLGRLDLEPLVSHRIGAEGVGEAFARMDAGVGARSLLEWAAA